MLYVNRCFIAYGAICCCSKACVGNYMSPYELSCLHMPMRGPARISVLTCIALSNSCWFALSLSGRSKLVSMCSIGADCMSGLCNWYVVGCQIKWTIQACRNYGTFCICDDTAQVCIGWAGCIFCWLLFSVCPGGVAGHVSVHIVLSLWAPCIAGTLFPQRSESPFHRTSRALFGPLANIHPSKPCQLRRCSNARVAGIISSWCLAITSGTRFGNRVLRF